MVDRDAVRDSARYLRQVRPLDPDELATYAGDGRGAHPAAVRRVLREEAYELGLHERPDGRFVPVDDEPVPPRGWAPTALPDRHVDALLDALAERLGPDWHRGASGDRLRETITRLKADYLDRAAVSYDEEVALAYACYHLPDSYAALGYVLDVLARENRLPRRLRVLDVGAGVGGPALALTDHLPAERVLAYHAVEPSAAADLLETLLDAAVPRLGPRRTVHRTRAESFDPTAAGPFDLVLCSAVLSELDEPVAVVERCLDALAPDGSLLALSPADRETSTNLRRVERAVADDGPAPATVFAPTLRLWPDAAPTDRCWSFDVGADLDPPAFQRRLDAAGPDDGTFLRPGVRFSYAILRRDDARRTPVRADPDRHARLAATDEHVTSRIALLAVKLSHDLAGDDGDGRGPDPNPVYLIGDGSQSTDHYAVLTRGSGLNRALREASYGAVLEFRNALALWNDDEAAYNLVVDAETTVDRVA